MKNHFILLSCLIIIVCGCHGDYGDLGSGYIYTNREIGRIENGGGWGYTPYKSIVPNEVMDFIYDKAYIVAIQIPDKEWLQYKKETVSNDKIDSIEVLYKEMCMIHHCYWIICKKTEEVFGPLNYETFISKGDSLNCNLTLKSPNGKIGEGKIGSE